VRVPPAKLALLGKVMDDVSSSLAVQRFEVVPDGSIDVPEAAITLGEKE
jgi:hypothetical protein